MGAEQFCECGRRRGERYKKNQGTQAKTATLQDTCVVLAKLRQWVMSTNQLFFAIAGLFAAGLGFLKYYIDAKVDGVDSKFTAKLDGLNGRLDGLASDIKTLMKYMIDHSERLAVLETRRPS